MAFDDPLTYGLIVVGVVIAAVIVFFVVRRRRSGKETVISEEKSEMREELSGFPFKVVKSIPREDAAHAKEELRILDLEREILSDAIRHLYEAQAEGKISEEERERLAQTYKSRMMTVKDAISKDESVVALHELETMQEDLMKLFSERFDELTGKIDELRSKVDVKPIKEITIAPPKTREFPAELEEKPAEEEKARKKRKQPQSDKSTPRTEAEKRIDEIREEVEKVLDRLGQMEIED